VVYLYLTCIVPLLQRLGTFGNELTYLYPIPSPFPCINSSKSVFSSCKMGPSLSSLENMFRIHVKALLNILVFFGPMDRNSYLSDQSHVIDRIKSVDVNFSIYVVLSFHVLAWTILRPATISLCRNPTKTLALCILPGRSALMFPLACLSFLLSLAVLFRDQNSIAIVLLCFTFYLALPVRRGDANLLDVNHPSPYGNFPNTAVRTYNNASRIIHEAKLRSWGIPTRHHPPHRW